MRRTLMALAVGTVGWATTAKAEPFVLTFEGLDDLEQVGSFYHGGLGGNGSGPGTNYGVVFNGDALALVDADAGGGGNFGGEPSPDTVLFFLSGTAILDYADGFEDGFSFFYSAINFSGKVQVYDGVGATGNLLAELVLALTAFERDPDPTGEYSPLVAAGVVFDGTARSIDFGGSANQIVFDNITFGSRTPVVPIPAALPLLGTALAGLAVLRRRRG